MRACGFFQRSLGAHLACAGALRLASLLCRGQPSTRLRVGDKTTRRTVGQSRGRARASLWGGARPARGTMPEPLFGARSGYLVDPASSHMLVSKIKPCMSQYQHFQS